MSRGIGSSIAGRSGKQRLNQPPDGEPFVWFTRKMIESDAWRSLSIHARRVIDRVILEHMAHAGTENGNLAVTHADFTKFGVRKASTKIGIDQAIERGFIAITAKGRKSSGVDRWPTRYALSWLPLKDGTPPSNRWKKWATPQGGPLSQDIESTPQTGGRDNGRNPRPLPLKTGVVPVPQTEGGQLA